VSKNHKNLVLFEEFFYDADCQHQLRAKFATISHSGPIKVVSTGELLGPESLSWSAQQLDVPFAETLSGSAFKGAQLTSQKIGAVFCDDSAASVKSLVQAWIAALGWRA
jgi:hypothetical protein